MKEWFTSDTHFGSERTRQLSRRPFKNTCDMDEALINNWNSNVSGDDIVYHLGDFGSPILITYLKFKTLNIVPGNYDTVDIIEELKEDSRVNILVENEPITTRNGIEFFLTHEPSRGTYRNVFYLFGHIHKFQMVKRNGLNVGCDCHDFCPISESTILFYKNAINHHYDENVFMDQIGTINHFKYK